MTITAASSLKRLRITSVGSISTSVRLDELSDEYYVGLTVSAEPSLWTRYIKLQGVKYVDPRFAVVDSWVITPKSGGVQATGHVSLDALNPRALEGERLVAGDNNILIHLRKQDVLDLEEGFQIHTRVFLNLWNFRYEVTGFLGNTRP